MKLAPKTSEIVQPVTAEEMNRARAESDKRERAKIHRLLLTETMRRLRAGRTLERSHGVIHPELTCIVRDALRLASLVFPAGAEEERQSIEDEATAQVVAITEGMEAIEKLVARSTASRVAQVAGLTLAELAQCRRGAPPTEDQKQRIAAKLKISIQSWDK